MEFLDALFNYEYFGPILFAVIAILIVLFFIILFFGKKEEKERILEETRRLELANLNAFKEEETVPVKVEVEEKEVLTNNVTIEDKIEPVQIVEREIVEEADLESVKVEEVVEEISQNDSPILAPIVETPLVTEEKVVEIVSEVPESDFRIEPSIPTNIPKYDFEELANSISKELEEIEKFSKSSQEVKKEETVLPIQESQVEVTPIKEIKKFKPTPVFSSVFVPQKEDVIEPVQENIDPKDVAVTPIVEPVVEPDASVAPIVESVVVVETPENEINNVVIPEENIVSQVQTETPKVEVKSGIDFSILKSNVVSNAQVSKPKVELPKTIELPKKNNESILESSIPDFEDIQGETYNISR